MTLQVGDDASISNSTSLFQKSPAVSLPQDVKLQLDPNKRKKFKVMREGEQSPE